MSDKRLNLLIDKHITFSLQKDQHLVGIIQGQQAIREKLDSPTTTGYVVLTSDGKLHHIAYWRVNSLATIRQAHEYQKEVLERERKERQDQFKELPF